MKKFLPLFAILIVTAAAYFPSLENEFTNWDDAAHVLEYPSIRELRFTNLKKIFTETVNNTYHPLTSLSFAVEHRFAGFNPFIYHLDNVLLHLAVVALVYLFCRQCGLPLPACVLATLTFGIHPIHAEAVAWVTARKDVLYAVFYMAALNCYLCYAGTGKKRFYVFTVVLGLLSMLAKAMALSLPLVLFLCDWIKKRRFSAGVILEKIPFFVYIIPIAAVTYKTHSFVSSADPQILKAALMCVWTFIFYIQKFFWPYPLVPLYTLPEPVSLAHPAYLWSSFLLVASVILLCTFRRNRWLKFAFLYYFLSIFFLLRTNTYFELNWIVVADRYMYLPSLGFCLLMGYVITIFAERTKFKNAAFAGAALIVTVLAVATFHQCKVWKNGFTLWDHAIKNSAANHLSYNNRGTMYLKEKKWDLALADFSKSIELNPGFPIVYLNRGDVYVQLKKDSLAFNDFTKAILLNPNLPMAYAKRGSLLSNLGRYDLALEDFNRNIALDALSADAYYNCGTVYGIQGKYDLALADFDKAISFKPHYAPAYHNRGTTYFYQGRYDSALADFNKVIELDPQYAMAYFKRAQVYQALGRMEEAWGESLKAQAMGYRVEPAYIQMLKDALAAPKGGRMP